MGEDKCELSFMALQSYVCGGDIPLLVSGLGFTCIVKQRREIEKLLDRGGSSGNIKY